MISAIQQKTGAGVRRICATLGLARSSYYHAAEPTSRQIDDQRLGDVIESTFREHKRRYGYRRIAQELLAEHDITASPERIRRIMTERDLRAVSRKSFVPKTSDGKASRPSPNLLEDKPLPTLPNRVWAGDITYIPVAGGWLYLAVVIDLFSRRVIGWHIADHMRADLVCQALDNALQSRGRRHVDLIFHSDRGSQYGSRAFRAKLDRAGITQSMSARANPYHNAWTESFIGTLKTEMLQDACFEHIQDARTALFDYIEAYYNTKRRHSALAYLSPARAEDQHLLKAA